MKACEIIALVKVKKKMSAEKLAEARMKIMNRIRSLKSQLARKKFTSFKKQNRKQAVLLHLEGVLKEL